jgi:hypothetical protein
MKRLLVIIGILFTQFSFGQSKWGYRIGVVTPLPFFIETPYIVHPSSALLQVNYNLSDKIKTNVTTGYLRFRSNSPEYKIISSVPLMIGATYNIGNGFYIGVGAGPSYINETEGKLDKAIRIIYSPYIGIQSGRWSVDLNYFNWEEVPDEVNSLTICVSYNF